MFNIASIFICVHPLIGEAAAADFAPDMDNCRRFMDKLIDEFQHHLYTEKNYFRQATILEIADRIVEFAAKNDVERYFYFLINACPYAEPFEDEHRMKSYISEMEKYFDSVSDKLSKAVYFMSRTAVAKIFSDDNAARFGLRKICFEVWFQMFWTGETILDRRLSFALISTTISALFTMKAAIFSMLIIITKMRLIFTEFVPINCLLPLLWNLRLI